MLLLIRRPFHLLKCLSFILHGGSFDKGAHAGFYRFGIPVPPDWFATIFLKVVVQLFLDLCRNSIVESNDRY